MASTDLLHSANPGNISSQSFWGSLSSERFKGFIIYLLVVSYDRAVFLVRIWQLLNRGKLSCNLTQRLKIGKKAGNVFYPIAFMPRLVHLGIKLLKEWKSYYWNFQVWMELHLNIESCNLKCLIAILWGMPCQDESKDQWTCEKWWAPSLLQAFYDFQEEWQCILVSRGIDPGGYVKINFAGLMQRMNFICWIKLQLE